MAKPIQGTPEGETLSGTDLTNDKLLGHAGDDTFHITMGHDTINGQTGYDTAIFHGIYTAGMVSTKNTGNDKTTITGAGYDTELKNVELIKFDNGTFDVGAGVFKAYPTISVSDAQRVEGQGPMVFTVSLSEATDHPVTIELFTQAQSATGGGVDYAGFFPTTYTFQPGQTVIQVSVPINNDVLVEGPETFLLRAQNAVGATLEDDRGTGTIIDNDFASPARVAVLPNNSPVPEGGALAFTFVRTGGDLNQELTVFLSHEKNPTQPQFGEVTDADLINPFPSTITFSAGQSNYTLVLPTLDDSAVEGFESVRLNIQPSSGYQIGIQNVGRGSSVSGILDNDQPPPPPSVTISVDQSTYNTGFDTRTDIQEGGDLLFTFARATPAANDLTIYFNINDTFFGGSTLGEDFVLANYNGPLVDGPMGHIGQFTILAGQSTATLEIDILTDDQTSNPDGNLEQGFFVSVAPDQQGFDYVFGNPNAIGVNVIDA